MPIGLSMEGTNASGSQGHGNRPILPLTTPRDGTRWLRLPALVACIWAFMGLMDIVFTSSLLALGGGQVHWRDFTISFMGFYGMAILLGFPMLWLLQRMLVQDLGLRRHLARIALLLPAFLAVHFLARYLWQWLFTPPGGLPDVALRPHNLNNLRWHFAGSIWIFVIHTIASNAWGYYVRFRERERAAAALELERANLRASLSEARIEALQAQLQPHFLFNALHAISTLILKQENRAANEMLAHLSRFLRMSLDHSESALVPLSLELEHLDAYLAVQRVRFTDQHLRIEVDIDDAVRSALVPVLVFQPLVENSIRHGIAASEGPGRIRVSACARGADLVLEVEDNGKGLPQDLDVLEGVGLGNIRQRLEQLFPGRHELTLGPGTAGGVRVRLTLPMGGGR